MNKKQYTNKGRYSGFGMVIGLAIGFVLGMFVFDGWIWIAGAGAGFGLIIGSIIETQQQKQRDE